MIPSIPEAEENYQSTAIANRSGIKASPPTQVEFFLCFSDWLGVWISHESSKFPKQTCGAAEINENFTIGVTRGQNVGVQFWIGGIRIFTDFAGVLVTIWCSFSTWMDMVLWEDWLGLKADQILLYVPHARARFSKLFLLEIFFVFIKKKINDLNNFSELHQYLCPKAERPKPPWEPEPHTVVPGFKWVWERCC